MTNRTSNPALHSSPEHSQRPRRRGVVIVLSALLIIVICAMTAMAVDVGFMMLVRTQLQVAADAGALAGGNALHMNRNQVTKIAKEYVKKHDAGGSRIKGTETLVEFGIWDTETNTFETVGSVGNAIRVTVTRQQEGLFFARVMGTNSFTAEASAIAMANPKDIAFVIDLSGSMNDDTEPAWATSTINSTFGSSGHPGIGSDLVQNLFSDFGYGAFPGRIEHVGAPLGVAADQWAYAEITKNDGPLAKLSIPAQYRIDSADPEFVRKQKAYRWIIDNQIARVMPMANPSPNSGSNYSYWEKYLDYIMSSVKIMPPPPPAPPSPTPSPSPGPKPTPGPPPGPKPPPLGFNTLPQHPLATEYLSALFAMRNATSVFTAHAAFGLLYSNPGDPGTMPLERGWLPPSHDGDRIHQFNNPNKAAFPASDSSLPAALRDKIGYLTYVQFMLDHGRDLKPDDKSFTPLSRKSTYCPLHVEGTPAGNFQFPPRTQPMHATRRAIIAALDIVHDRNRRIPSENGRDRVALITYDSVAGSELQHELTVKYRSVMKASTRLQSAGDKGATTATEVGLRMASEHLKTEDEGGAGREGADKIVVLLTDGMPNVYESGEGSVDAYMTSNPHGDFYGGGYYWLDAALMRAHEMELAGVELYPVGVGLGTDLDFMDRAARIGGTGGRSGQSFRGSGNPAEYESKMVEIFKKIVTTPTARLVE